MTLGTTLSERGLERLKEANCMSLNIVLEDSIRHPNVRKISLE